MVSAQQVTATLRIRDGAPSTTAPRVGAFQVGATFFPEEQVVGETVAGNATWFRLAASRYVWGGGCIPATADAAAAASLTGVVRRTDGTLKTLGNDAIGDVFGLFNYDELPGGRVKVERTWADKNLAEISSPVLDAIGQGPLTVHKKAVDPFSRAFDAIERAGLGKHILTCAGSWVPRHKGWDPKRTLSAHSWGIAIDFNVAWNGYGQVPAARGAIGSLREVVSLFEAEGIAWGGYFQPLSICDGMHFELARADL